MEVTSTISLDFLPRSLKKSLFNFQKEGVRFGISKQGRCLIADEMGLGKTLQAISIAYYLKDAWPLLIVVPSSVKFSWIDEIEKWLPEVEPHNINLIRSGSDISNLGRAVIHVIGYGLLSVATSKLLMEALESQRFNVVILDESHYLKERKAVRTKRIHQLCRKAKHAILLSGTPSLARPRELYIQLDIVCPGKFGSFSSFVKRYCDAHSVCYRGERRFDTTGASNLEELYNLLKRHVMIRRLKKEVLTQLPPKRRQRVVFDISESSSKDKKELQQVMEKFRKCAAVLRGDADDPSIQSPIFEMRKLSILVYKYTGIVKIGPVLKYIEDLAQGMEGKFIVFFRHRVVRQAIVEKLVKLKLKHICIAGDVPSAIRGDLVHSFQTDPQVRIAALSIEAASFGLTLTAAHHVVFAELHHTPGVIIQAEDRAHRIGQTLPVNVHYLIARSTVDEILWNMIRRKIHVTSTTLDGVCNELKVEDGDEDQGRQLSACAAWVQEQEEDAGELEEFVMAELSSTKNKPDASQRDLRSFFTPTLHTRASQSKCTLKDEEKSRKMDVTSLDFVSVVDSDDDDDGLALTCNNEENDKDAVVPARLHFLSVSPDVTKESVTMEQALPNTEETKYKEPEQPTPETMQSDTYVHNSTNGTQERFELSTIDSCPLKPKAVKFKKEKDGKLTFARSKCYTKLRAKESQCKGSPSETAMENDPDSESQTMRSYYDCELTGVSNAAEEDVSNVTNGNGTDGKHHKPFDRGFLASLRVADVECVSVVCKRTSRISTQSNAMILEDEDTLGTTSQQEKDDQFADGNHKADEKVNDGKGNDFNGHNCVSDFVTKEQFEPQELQIPPEHSCTVLGDCPSDSHDTKVEINSVGNAIDKMDVEESHPSGKETKRDAMGMNSFVHEDGESLSVGMNITRTLYPRNTTCSCLSFGCSDATLSNFTNEDPDFRCNCHKETVGEDFQSFEELDPSSLVSPRLKKCANKSDADERGDSTCRYERIDEVSSDDFETRCVRQYQTAAKVKQKPVKRKRRKAKKRVNNTSASFNAVCQKSNKDPPSWSCNSCTFINDGQLLECSICFTPRILVTEDDKSTSDSNKKDRIDLRARTREFERAETLRLPTAKMDSNLSAQKEIQRTLTRNEVKLDEDTSNVDIGGTLDDFHLPPWQCSVCTFFNIAEMIECSICLTPRRRSQRCRESNHSHADNTNIDKSSRKRRRKRDTLVKDENKQVDFISQSSWKRVDEASGDEMEIIDQQGRIAEGLMSEQTTSSCFETNVKRAGKLQDEPVPCAGELEGSDIGLQRGINEKHLTPQQERSSKCDVHQISDDEGVILQPSGRQHDHSDVGVTNNIENNVTVPLGTSNAITSQPRKRLKLDDCMVSSVPVDNSLVSEILDSDSDIQFKNSSSALASSVGPSAVNWYSTSDLSSDGSGGTGKPKEFVFNTACEWVSSRNNVSCKSQSPQKETHSEEVTCKSIDPFNQHSNAECSRTVLENPLSKSHVVNDPLPGLPGNKESYCKEMEHLEELKAAAEEVFMSEWEDDNDHWWEEDSSSKQSSYPSSSDAASSSHSVPEINKGFVKCSQLYSINELKDRLLSSPEQSKRDASTADRPEVVADHKTAAPEYQEDEDIVEPDEIPEPMKLKFCLSLYTERVFLYNEDHQPLGINFCVSDVINANTEDLPSILHNDYNLKQVKRFLNSWKRMGEGKKRVLRKSALIFDDPLEAYECARKGITRESSYLRHPSKEAQIKKVVEIAEEVGGTVRLIKKPTITKGKTRKTDSGHSANDSTLPVYTHQGSDFSESTTQNKACYQAVGADRTPLCLFCSGPVEFADKLRCSDWDKRFCSHDCKKEYQVRGSGTAARRELFEVEKGVCQLCSLDAHSLYLSVKALHVRDRAAYLAQTPYASLPQQMLKKMVMEPKEGMFWEADHIIPVSEGGGECGLDNYRTLCVMCHKKATEELNRRLKHRKLLQNAVGYGDISTFFRPLWPHTPDITAKSH
ncbi:uncharacterized protein [Montipora capricornis]|uniref:uncharacterized protein isoform X1 n=1 Tax=Montipora capricornis TaxID=246305 RepID=UPI0035F1D652